MTRKKKSKLTWLSTGHKQYPKRPDKKILETFDNRHLKRNYTITFDCPEYTSVCPITGQPDFARIIIRYIPNRLCIESKSLKLYLFSYRDVGTFFESAVNNILEDLVLAAQPRHMTVRGEFHVRGGIGMTVEAEYSNKMKK